MTNNCGLSEKSTATLNKILAAYPHVEKAILYGSRAMGNYKNGSDIDLSLQGESLDQRIIFKLTQDFAESSLPYKVDVSVFEQIESAKLKEHIKRVGVVFYEKSDFMQHRAGVAP